MKTAGGNHPVTGRSFEELRQRGRTHTIRPIVKWILRASCAAVGLFLFASRLPGQTVLTAPDPNEPVGVRPYEMVWANRAEPAPPTVRFDDLKGWQMEVNGGAQATLQVSRAQNVWDRPVARLRYHGTGQAEAKPRILLRPPRPLPLPGDADAVDMWVFGNRWSWENPPGTPPVNLVLHLRDGEDQPRELSMDAVRWQEWWLLHRKLPAGWKPPLRFVQLEVAGGWQSDWRELFFDSIRFYHEELPPLTLAARPRRNLTLFRGQSPGANTGAAKLPFPTRETTILPPHFGSRFRNETRRAGAGFAFTYRGDDGVLSYHFDPSLGLASVRATFAPEPAGAAPSPVGRLLDGAGVRCAGAPTRAALTSATLARGVVTAGYEDGTTLQLRIWQKSLVVDVINRTGRATELEFGQLSEVTDPRPLFVPYLTYGGGAHPCVLLSRSGTNHVFTSVWLDWYRSNGSEPFAAESATNDTARINGGVRYLPRTDGQRNPMFERFFLTVSPRFEEVLPTVPNPVGRHAPEAVDRLWQESWGPEDYEQQMKRSRRLRAYGIDRLIQCNHEIAWRDGGESFTLRTRAAPKKGGDAALQRYVAHQRSLGWRSGLYSNYTDYAPVNEFWSPDGVQRTPDGEWRTAWPRCYAEKPLKAVEFDALLAPQIKAKYRPDSAYTDVQTAVAPWQYNDYDARVPGAGTFAQTFYAYGELLRNDSRVYDGPIFSEGSYHWLYAGLADGNYALAYDGRPLAREPLLPVFDLYQIHPKECDIGMGWTANFCDAIPDWQKPENLDRAIDRFLLHTLAYGHIGWLVEESHGLARTGRSYYMLQQVQARYGLKAPTRIAYWDGTSLVSVSEALIRDLPRTRRQLLVEYPGGLQLWLNDHPSDNWDLPAIPPASGTHSKHRRSLQANAGTAKLVLPPAGWAAFTKDGTLFSASALTGTNRTDYLRSPAYVYMDGRGQWFDAPEAASNGALAIRPAGKAQLEVIRISGTGGFVVRRPYQVRGNCVSCEAYDEEGQRLAAPARHDTGQETRIEPVENAIVYRLRFGSRR